MGLRNSRCLFVVSRLRGIRDSGLVGSNGAHAVFIGCHELLSIILCIGIVGIQHSDTAISAIGSAPERAGQQACRIQLRRTQRQVVDTVGGVRQVYQVAPLQVGGHHIGALRRIFIHIKLIRLLAVLIRKGDLQVTVGRYRRRNGAYLRCP